MNHVSLTKGDHRFVFRYEVGDEAKVLDALVATVNLGCGFDWFDAAILSHQVAQKLAVEIGGYAKGAK